MSRFAALFLLFATTAHADTDWKKNCDVAADAAEVVMDARQAGVSLSAMLNRQKEGTPQGDMFIHLILATYEYPMYKGKDAISKVVANFRTEQQLACIKIRRPKP